ncbi:sacsin [Entomortierella parvispora]|uniref:Sacsin n=1 Tax=Entomortierella parvispora TaxID=205924 RepID=A0A9P3LZ55_9FUNG|nr:sacsin [Entomortierella parvispora]
MTRMDDDPQRGRGAKPFRVKVSLTGSIAQVLNDYPDGAQIARELLQNSEDAGATRQWYLLDHRTHSSQSVYCKGMEQYMGPALLAGNDSLFKEKDFDSLQNFGNSGKKTDYEKIGQMGIGFNSVYHMTDCPSFLSHDQLVILEPHENILRHGGIQGDFVFEREGLDRYADQINPFKAMDDRLDLSKPYNGTIFRLPLRTKVQAATSQISNRAYSTQQARDMLMMLKEDALECLLFLKHIEQIRIYERTDSSKEPVLLFGIEIENAEEIREERTKFIERLRSFSNDSFSTKCSGSTLESFIRPQFKIRDEYGKETVETWQVTSMLGDMIKARQQMEEQFKCDTSGHRLIPWVGIASPVDSAIKIKDPRLFCFLPIGHNAPFPVHINGHFAVKPSRREIWTNQGNDISEQSNARIKAHWNEYMMMELVPKVYARFLENMGLDHGPDYSLWPEQSNEGIPALFHGMQTRMLTEAIKEKRKIFFIGPPSSKKAVAFENCNVADQILGQSTLLVDILHQMTGVAMGLPDRIHASIRTVANNMGLQKRLLNPARVRNLLLQFVELFSKVSSSAAKCQTLEYCSGDQDIEALEGLPLLPMADGTWVNFNKEARDSRFLVNDLEYEILSFSNAGIVRFNEPNFPYWIIQDPKKPWISWTINSSDLVSVAGKYLVNISSVSGVLSILCSVSASKLSTLDQSHGKVLSQYIQHHLSSGQQLSQDQQASLRKLPIFYGYKDSELKSFDALSMEHGSAWYICEDFSFSDLPWVPSGMTLFQQSQDLEIVLKKVLEVPILKEHMYWVHLLPNLPKMPEAEWDKIISAFAQKFQSYSERYSFKSILQSLEFVTVGSPLSGTQTKRIRPQHAISSKLGNIYLQEELYFSKGIYAQDPISTMLQSLGMTSSFREELARERILTIAGIWENEAPSSNTSVTVIAAALFSRVQRLCSEQTLSQDLTNVIQSSRWIPGSISTNPFNFRLYTSKECRPSDDRILLGDTMPAVDICIPSPTLRRTFGWDQPPPLDKVLKRLLQLIEPGSEKSELSEKYLTAIYLELLGRIYDPVVLAMIKETVDHQKWILVNRELYATDCVAFSMPSFLAPESVQLPSSALDPLFKALGVADSVEVSDLQRAIRELGAQYGDDTPLPEHHATRVIKILEHIAATPPDSEEIGDLKDLLILNKDLKLCRIDEIVYDDVNEGQGSPDIWTDSQEETYNKANSRISHHVATKLNITMLSTLYWHSKKDSDIQPWAQQEDIAVRIRHILNDYDPSTIFQEFLQNAEDAGATKCVFMLDDRSYESQSILCPEMAACQGPSLIIYNDAEFTKDDFLALCKIGVGNKSGDFSKIGRNGLGFNSAYHFTDIPSVVSGTHIGFFDPHRAYLPKFRTSKGLMAEGGIRIDFRIFKGQTYADQMAPYKGLFGCDMETHFKGTIFRFPLRTMEIVPAELTTDSFQKSSAPIGLPTFMSFSDLLYCQPWRDLTWTKCAYFPDNLEMPKDFREAYKIGGGANVMDCTRHLRNLVKLAPDCKTKDEKITFTRMLFKIYAKFEESQTAIQKTIAAQLNTTLEGIAFILNGAHLDPAVKASWRKPSELMLDIQFDMNDQQPVHPSLFAFKTFLRTIGVQEIKEVVGDYSVKVSKGRDVGGALERALTESFEKQDSVTGFMDVKFTFSDLGSGSVKSVLAHKFVLAHTSEHFLDRFTGLWAKLTPDDPEDPRLTVVNMPKVTKPEEGHDVFWGILYYLYTDNLIRTNGPPSATALPERANEYNDKDAAEDRVQYLVDLLKAAAHYRLKRLQSLIAAALMPPKSLITLVNALDIRATARVVEQSDLIAYCTDFIHENRETIENFVRDGIQRCDEEIQHIKGGQCDPAVLERLTELESEQLNYLDHLQELEGTVFQEER